MNFLNKMERKFGRYAIPELTKYIILCYVIGYALEVFQNMTGVGIMGYLALSPYHILHGQIWRLVSWVLIPPSGLDIFTIIMLLFYYSLGTALERTWGEFRYNVYIFSGILFTVIGAFLLYFIGGLQISLYGASIISTYYINLSIFLAFAATNACSGNPCRNNCSTFIFCGNLSVTLYRCNSFLTGSPDYLL